MATYMAHMHEPGPAPLGHLHLQKGVAHRATQTLAAPIGAILGLADLPQAPAPHEEDNGHGQRRDEAGVDQPVARDVPQNLACRHLAHDAPPLFALADGRLRSSGTASKRSATMP